VFVNNGGQCTITLGNNCHIRQLFEVSIKLRTSAVIWTHFWCG
jgi:hypothetical protein